MKTETWKAVKGFEEKYQVSNYGNVKSLIRNRILKGGINTSGYYQVTFYKGKKRYNPLIHVLVANAFISIKPRKCKFEVMHLDGNKLNNHIDNLRYGSRSCNQAFRVDDGTDNLGERNGMAILNRDNVKSIRKLHLSGLSAMTIANKFNVAKSTISSILSGQNWAWLK